VCVQFRGVRILPGNSIPKIEQVGGRNSCAYCEGGGGGAAGGGAECGGAGEGGGGGEGGGAGGGEKVH